MAQNCVCECHWNWPKIVRVVYNFKVNMLIDLHIEMRSDCADFYFHFSCRKLRKWSRLSQTCTFIIWTISSMDAHIIHVIRYGHSDFETSDRVRFQEFGRLSWPVCSLCDCCNNILNSPSKLYNIVVLLQLFAVHCAHNTEFIVNWIDTWNFLPSIWSFSLLFLVCTLSAPTMILSLSHSVVSLSHFLPFTSTACHGSCERDESTEKGESALHLHDNPVTSYVNSLSGFG